MKPRTVHEPEAELLTAEDAIADAERLIELFEKKDHERSKTQGVLSLDSVLAAIEEFPKKDLLVVKQRLEARLLAKCEAKSPMMEFRS